MAFDESMAAGVVAWWGQCLGQLAFQEAVRARRTWWARLVGVASGPDDLVGFRFGFCVRVNGPGQLPHVQRARARVGVLDEAAVRRVVGGPAIMRAQLEHLVESAQLPNLSIQVLPFATGSHAGLRGSFSVFDLPHPADPTFVYVDCPAGNIYLEDHEQVRDHQSRFSHLQVAALDQPSSVRLLEQAAKEMT